MRRKIKLTNIAARITDIPHIYIGRGRTRIIERENPVVVSSRTQKKLLKKKKKFFEDQELESKKPYLDEFNNKNEEVDYYATHQSKSMREDVKQRDQECYLMKQRRIINSVKSWIKGGTGL